MADEITVTIQARISNGEFVEPFGPFSAQIDQSAIGLEGGVQVVGTSEEVLSVNADVSTLGVAGFKNLDAANYVDIGPESGGSMVALIRLKAGETAFMRLKPGVVLRGQANTSAVKLKKWIAND